jgi:hypothetical protein
VEEIMKIDEFLNPKSMLTPALVGSMVMMITNAVYVQFGLPKGLVGLALSFTVGLLIVVKLMVPIWQRIIYYLLNSLFIFSVAAGASDFGGKAIEHGSAPLPVKSAPSGPL